MKSSIFFVLIFPLFRIFGEDKLHLGRTFSCKHENSAINLHYLCVLQIRNYKSLNRKLNYVFRNSRRMCHSCGIGKRTRERTLHVQVLITEDTYTVTAMKETLERSNLGLLNVGDKVNVERSMMMNGRLDGHIVQGHVDQTATCISVEDAEGSYYFTFRYAFDKEMAKRGYITVDKGSVTVNGVSLTVCNPTDDTFQVAIIPYTFEYTNFHDIKVDSVVNIEFDIIGKYISRMLQFK